MFVFGSGFFNISGLCYVVCSTGSSVNNQWFCYLLITVETRDERKKPMQNFEDPIGVVVSSLFSNSNIFDLLTDWR